MNASIKDVFVMYVQWSHKSLLATTETLSVEQFVIQPSPTTPPIGWHLFHMARWADRLQANFGYDSSESVGGSCYPGEVWIRDGLAERWELEPKRLGFLETGAGMKIEDAVNVAAVGQPQLLDYATKVFTLADQTIADLPRTELSQQRPSILPRFQRTLTGELTYTEEKTVDVAADIVFHISHAGRHLGMIEALRGALGLHGTASV